jgi:hypothetical protein
MPGFVELHFEERISQVRPTVTHQKHESGAGIAYATLIPESAIMIVCTIINEKRFISRKIFLLM